MTQPDQYTPESAANYSSLAAFAAKTADDWTDDLTAKEVARWGLPRDVLDGKWTDIVNAKTAADYANAQLAVQNRPIVDLFDGPAGTAPSGSWDVRSLGIGGGTAKMDGLGSLVWNPFGGLVHVERYRWNVATTTGDDQVVSIVMPTAVQKAPLLSPNSHMRILAKVVDTSTIDTFVYAEITDENVELGCYVSDSQTIFNQASLSMRDGSSWDFYLSGTNFGLKRDGVIKIAATSSDGTATASTGAGFRSVGFEMWADSRTLLTQSLPGTIAVFSADDN